MDKKIKIPTFIVSVFVLLMLTVGIGAVQYQGASIAKNAISEAPTGCGISYDGYDEYCIIASGAAYAIELIESGDLSFSELQAYMDGLASGGGMESQSRYSFDAMPIEDTSIISIGGDQSIDDITGISRDYTFGSGDVRELLVERLSQAEVYCDVPAGVPDDWQFHPESFCLAVGMIPIIGASMANAVVSAFYALFGGMTWLLGLSQWVLVLHAFEVPQSAINAGIILFNSCMDLLGGAETG